MITDTRTIAALVVVGLVATAGCTAVIGDDIDGETVADRVADRHDEIDDIRGVTTTETTADGETERVTQEVWERPPTEFRAEVIETTGLESPGDTTVRNESTMWFYDSEANEVTTTDAVATDDPATIEAGFVEYLVEEFEFEYDGTETVADRDTYVVDLTPATNETEDLYEAVTVWIDQEYWFPLKQDVTMEVLEGERIQMTTTYEEIAFNEGIDDERFVFDPPADATVTEGPSYEESQFDDRDAAAAAAPFDLPDVTTPEGYEFETATVTEFEESSTVNEKYAGGDDSIWLSVSADGEPLVTDPDREDVGEVDASVEETYGTTFVGWECDGLTLSVWSDSVGEETLLEMADGVGCE